MGSANISSALDVLLGETDDWAPISDKDIAEFTALAGNAPEIVQDSPGGSIAIPPARPNSDAARASVGNPSVK